MTTVFQPLPSAQAPVERYWSEVYRGHALKLGNRFGRERMRRILTDAIRTREYGSERDSHACRVFYWLI